MVKNKSIIKTVLNLLTIAKSGYCSDEDLSEISELLTEHSEHQILGRINGYSISDYAFATLKWLNTPETICLFEKNIQGIDKNRLSDIEDLVSSKCYTQI